MGWRRRRAPIRLHSRWLPGYWLRHPLLSLVVLLVGAVGLLLLEIDSAYRTHRLNTYGMRAEAPSGAGSTASAGFMKKNGSSRPVTPISSACST